MQMPDFVTLTCPSCGARLQVSNDLQRFACAHCGNEHIVKRNGGVVSLFPALDDAERIAAGVDRTAIELTIARLEREIKAGRDAPDEIRIVKNHYVANPKAPVSSQQGFWQEAAAEILQRRNPKHRNSAFGSLRNFWDGGCSEKEGNEVLATLTLAEIDFLLQWLGSTNFTRKYQRDCLPKMMGHLQRLKDLEELRADVPRKEAELRRLQQMLKA